MKQFYTIFLSMILVLIAFIPANTKAEESESKEDSVVNAYLPFARYASDIGVMAGGIWNRYHYLEGVSPFNNFTDVRLQASTKGRMNVTFYHERLNALGTDFRVRSELVFDRFLYDNFFGIGNNTPLDEELWDDRWYNYESLEGNALLKARYPLRDDNKDQHFDLLLLGGYNFYRARELDDYEGLIFQDYPEVNDHNHVSFAGTGILWDSRNNEFDPGSGTYFEADIRFSPGLIAGHDPFYSIRADMRAFYSIERLDDLVLAGRLGGELAGGDAPFMMLPVLGGEDNLRGYYLNRFRDDAILHNTLALRKWLVSFNLLSLRVGLQAFNETGKVFGKDDEEAFFDNLHTGTGGSLLLSAFTEDFIVRIDYALSDETGRLYTNIGYVF